MPASYHSVSSPSSTGAFRGFGSTAAESADAVLERLVAEKAARLNLEKYVQYTVQLDKNAKYYYYLLYKLWGTVRKCEAVDI